MVKDEISDWTAALKARNISDWLVVVVVYEESKVKSKLLRTSVYDRVKSDFCSKHSDRYLIRYLLPHVSHEFPLHGVV